MYIFKVFLQLYMLYFNQVEFFKWKMILVNSFFLSLSPGSLFFPQAYGIRYSITYLSIRFRITGVKLKLGLIECDCCLKIPWCSCQWIFKQQTHSIKSSLSFTPVILNLTLKHDIEYLTPQAREKEKTSRW